MTPLPDLSPVRLRDLERTAQLFALLADRVQKHDEVRRWLDQIANAIETEHAARLRSADRLLGSPDAATETPQQHVDFRSLHVVELEVLHGVLRGPASEPGSGGRWLTKLLALAERELDRREAAQDAFAPDDPNAALHRAQAAAMDAEIERERQASRPESDLSRLPSWREASGG
ncbi:hypothetical protein [Mycolicibacterium tokaiense]|uniref:hypothetical protein n=1 Tax=Mycolicibacterium tokaiense TaxID=39695 RepID=UPI00138BADC2|nr:hypothetical protein [Mycolicibacterium tokaiense]BBY86501.1 hypothetical protein MTOK_22830 [Mycolicibacterium tokaiense]